MAATAPTEDLNTTPAPAPTTILGDLEVPTGFDARASERVLDLAAQSGALGEPDELVRRWQVGQVDHLTVGQSVVTGHDHNERVAPQGPVVESFRQLLGPQPHDGEVEATGGDRRCHLGAGGVDEVVVDAGMACVVVGHHLDHVEGAGQSLDQSQAQPSTAQAGQRVQLFLGMVHIGEDALGQRHEQFTGRGQPHRAAGPAEQLGAYVLLQPRDLLTEGGLRDVAVRGSPGEVATLGNGEEVLQVTQFHL